jgi:hypothetical protein
MSATLLTHVTDIFYDQLAYVKDNSDSYQAEILEISFYINIIHCKNRHLSIKDICM